MRGEGRVEMRAESSSNETPRRMRRAYQRHGAEAKRAPTWRMSSSARGDVAVGVTRPRMGSAAGTWPRWVATTSGESPTERAA